MTMPYVDLPVLAGEVFQDSPTTEPYTGVLENRLPQFNPANCSCQCGRRRDGNSGKQDLGNIAMDFKSQSILKAAHINLPEKPPREEWLSRDLLCPGNSTTLSRRHSSPQYHSVQPAITVALAAERLCEPRHLIQEIGGYFRLPGPDTQSETNETRPATPSSVYNEPPQSGTNSMASSVVSLLSMRSATPSYILMGLASEYGGFSDEDSVIGSFRALLPMHDTRPARSFFVQAPLWLTAQPRYCLPTRAWGSLNIYPAVIADEDIAA